MIVLRDYQTAAVTAVYNSWASGSRNVCCVLPTGAGKSIVVSEIVKNSFANRMKVAVIAHRNELVSQMASHLARRGIPHKVIASNPTISAIIRNESREFGKSFVNPSSPIAVIGVDTLMSRAEDLTEWSKQICLWIIDECHHLVRGNKWGHAVEMFPNAYGLGVTATPKRADGQGLSRNSNGYMDGIVVGPTMRQLIEFGNLSDYEIVCPKSDLNVDNLDVCKNGDWDSKRLKQVAKESKIVGDVVANYKKYAAGRRAIVFATDIETAGNISDSFNEAGFRAGSVNGKSQLAYREQCLEQFKTGQMQVLVNVDLFDEGFDVPQCDVVIMARPTMSLGKYLQEIGRALRPAPGKTALIIDHVSNVVRHGLPDKPQRWTIEATEKRKKTEKDPDEIELTTCKNCLKPYEKFRTACPYCGAEKPLPEPRERSVEMVDGDLILLDRSVLERMRRETQLEPAGDVARRVAAVAGVIAGKGVAKRQTEKIEAQADLKEAIAQWAAIEREKGFNDSEIYRRFYLSAGTDVLSSLSVSHSKKDYETLAERVKGWYSCGNQR